MRFPECHNEWNSDIFDGICTIRSGIGFKANEYVNTGVRLLKIDNIGYGKIKWDNISYLPTHYVDKYKDLVLTKKDIVLALNRPITNNKLKISRLNEDDLPAILYQRVGKINIRSNFDFNFIYYALLRNVFDFVLKTSIGSDQPFISTEKLKEMRICYPNIEIQKKIGLFLNKIDERIETQNKIIDEYDSVLNYIKDEVMWVTKDTKRYTIKDILGSISVKSTIQNEYPVLSSTVKGLYLQSEYFGKNIASETNIGYKIVKYGDIIISPQNLWMGNITYNDKYENGIVSPSYHVFEINQNFNPIYISFLLKSNKALYLYKTVSEQGASIVRRNLNIDAFFDLSLNIPTLEIQNDIAKLITTISNKINIETRYLELLKNQKQFLLNNLFI